MKSVILFVLVIGTMASATTLKTNGTPKANFLSREGGKEKGGNTLSQATLAELQSYIVGSFKFDLQNFVERVFSEQGAQYLNSRRLLSGIDPQELAVTLEHLDCLKINGFCPSAEDLVAEQADYMPILFARTLTNIGLSLKIGTREELHRAFYLDALVFLNNQNSI